MADEQATSSGSENGRSRAAEFTSKPESEEVAARSSDDATPDPKVGETLQAAETQPAEIAGASVIGADPGTGATSTPRIARPGKFSERSPDARALATEVPAKIAPVPQLSEYVVTVDNASGLVTRIERFNPVTAERQSLSPAGHAKVASQFLMAPESVAAGAVIPKMLDAPAFNILAARAEAASPTFSETTRSAVKAGLMASADRPAAPAAGKGGVASGSTAVLQAYYQGALDYLNALATGAVNGR